MNSGSAATDLALRMARHFTGRKKVAAVEHGYHGNTQAGIEIREQGGVCISDEVQTGFGHLGDYFWGFEMHEVTPGIVIIGKPMGHGHPMGAVVCTDEIAEAFNNGMEFFSSFGGNPGSCAIGQAVLDVLEEEQLQQNANEVGNYYRQQLSELQQKHELKKMKTSKISAKISPTNNILIIINIFTPFRQSVDYDEYFLEIRKCEFGNLLKIKDNYRKIIVTMNEVLVWSQQ